MSARSEIEEAMKYVQHSINCARSGPWTEVGQHLGRALAALPTDPKPVVDPKPKATDVK